MKIVKTTEVKDPEQAGEHIIFYIPDNFPGTHFLAHGQDVPINLGVEVKVPKGCMLLALSSPYGQVSTSILEETGELIMTVTNTGWDVVQVEPGSEALQAVLIRIKVEGIEI